VGFKALADYCLRHKISIHIISGYTGMMLTVDAVNSQPSTVNSELEFTIPMLTDLISLAHLAQFSLEDFIIGWGLVYEIINFRQLYFVKPALIGLWRMPQDINSLAL
jgi:hypothetical protein